MHSFEDCWEPGGSLIPLAIKEGERYNFDPEGIFPPFGVMVVFLTFDGILYYGETLTLDNAGKSNKITVAFLIELLTYHKFTFQNM